ncbi:MAG: hypothetical protein LBT97_12410, partial [Planctomycetota bacterium]|nr:hypothetical protein [Planctomycetota bacterium]
MNSKNSLRIVIAALVIAFVGGLYYLYTQVKIAGDRWPAYNEPGSLTATISRLEREMAELNMEVVQIAAAREELA